MALKNTGTKLLDSNWFCYNQVGMLLEKSENLLELSVKQLVIQLRLASSISLGQAIFGVINKMLILFLAKLGVFVSNKSCLSLKSNLIPFNPF